jgi:predicted dehydrogenase
VKRYRVAVVGLGHGSAHAKITARYLAQTELVMLCDVNPDRLERWSAELGVRHTATRYADVLANPEVDIVCIATPDDSHGRMVLAALDADKHVLVENPMEADSMERISKIIQMAERRHLKVHHDCPDRWIPESRRMKELIDQGAVGDIFYVITEYIQDFRLQRGAHTKEGFRWGMGVQAQHAVSSGAAMYAIDTAQWFLGEQFTEVYAIGNRKNWPSRNVDDHEVALFKTQSGAIARVQCSKLVKRPYKEIVKSVWGTKGCLDSNGSYPPREDTTGLWGSLGQDPEDPNAMHPIDVPPISLPNGLALEVAKDVGHSGVEIHSWLDFVASIENDSLSSLNVYEAARTCAAAVAIRKSKELGIPIPIPQVMNRHEEIKPHYPLPYARASSDEL